VVDGFMDEKRRDLSFGENYVHLIDDIMDHVDARGKKILI
jgi:hypothetical protein